MKLFFEFEDAIVGVICGLMLIGFTGKFFSIKLISIIYLIAFIVFTISIILDIIFEFTDLKIHFGLTIVSLIHNVIDLIISLTLISYFSGWNIPFITTNIVPYLQNEAIIFGIGIFLAISNAIWLAIYPFLK